jgi:nucleoside 2-deoxyribosyltransferase
MSSAWVESGVLSGPWRVGICGELSEMNNSAKTTATKCFYLATRKDRSVQADAISEVLRALGWKRTFAWANQDAGSPGEHAATAVAEIESVREADVLIVLLPGGYGTHVEIGAALALRKPVILHAPDRKTLETPYPCVFHYHPRVKLLVSEVLDIDALLAFMAECAQKSTV